MKILVVGYGSIGKRHIKNILKVSDNQIIVCTKQKDNFLYKNNCIVHESLNDCLKEKPDIGLITNVTSLHVDAAIKCNHYQDAISLLQDQLEKTPGNVRVKNKLSEVEEYIRNQK